MLRNIPRAFGLIAMYSLWQLSQFFAVIAAGFLIAGDWFNDRLFR